MRKQKSPAEFGFDRYDKGRLQRALQKVKDKRTFLRLKAVLLVAQGMNIREVSGILGRSFQIIYTWIKAYLKHHSALTLQDAFKVGRPISAKGITKKRILRELKRNPLDLGYNTTVWTVNTLARHLTLRYGVEVRPRTLRRRMKQTGLRCKQPKYVYSEKDPHRAQKKGPSSES